MPVGGATRVQHVCMHLVYWGQLNMAYRDVLIQLWSLAWEWMIQSSRIINNPLNKATKRGFNGRKCTFTFRCCALLFPSWVCILVNVLASDPVWFDFPHLKGWIYHWNMAILWCLHRLTYVREAILFSVKGKTAVQNVCGGSSILNKASSARTAGGGGGHQSIDMMDGEQNQQVSTGTNKNKDNFIRTNGQLPAAARWVNTATMQREQKSPEWLQNSSDASGVMLRCFFFFLYSLLHLKEAINLEFLHSAEPSAGPEVKPV